MARLGMGASEANSCESGVGVRKLIAVMLCIVGGIASHAHAANPSCAQEAREQARLLLNFYTENDERAVIDKQVKKLPSIPNPANTTQMLEVYEVMGHVYKGQYQMQITYFNNGHCVLMGEKILELADL